MEEILISSSFEMFINNSGKLAHKAVSPQFVPDNLLFEIGSQKEHSTIALHLQTNHSVSFGCRNRSVEA